MVRPRHGSLGDVRYFRGEPVKVAEGDIWVGWADQAGSQRLTFEGGWSWPVFAVSDKEIIALREGELWSLPVAGGIR